MESADPIVTVLPHDLTGGVDPKGEALGRGGSPFDLERLVIDEVDRDNGC